MAEILLLKELGRVAVGLPQLNRAFREAPGLRFLPLDLPRLEEFVAVAGIRDPSTASSSALRATCAPRC